MDFIIHLAVIDFNAVRSLATCTSISHVQNLRGDLHVYYVHAANRHYNFHAGDIFFYRKFNAFQDRNIHILIFKALKTKG